MKIIFNDLTELKIQNYSFDGDKLNIKSLERVDTLREYFSDPLKTRKMDIVEGSQIMTTIIGYTEVYSFEMYLGGIFGVNMYKPYQTPEASLKVVNDVIKMAKNQAKSLSDEEALNVLNLFDEFDFESNYKRDDRVLDNGVLYKALHDIKPTDMQGKTPSEMPTLWSKVLGESGIEPWEQPGSTNGYKRGAKVIHNGKTWESLQDNNVWEPGTVGAPWKEVNE